MTNWFLQQTWNCFPFPSSLCPAAELVIPSCCVFTPIAGWQRTQRELSLRAWLHLTHHWMLVCLSGKAEHLGLGPMILIDSPSDSPMRLTVPKLFTASSLQVRKICTLSTHCCLSTIQCYIKMFRHCVHQLYWISISNHLAWQQYFRLEGYACINLFLFSNSFLSPVLSASHLQERRCTKRESKTTAKAAHADAIWSSRHCPAVRKSTSFLFLVVFSVLLLMIKAVLKVNICNCSKYKMTSVA